jgi:hypothetical protein
MLETSVFSLWREQARRYIGARLTDDGMRKETPPDLPSREGKWE